MGDPVRLLLTNAGAAGLIALLAWAASRVLRRHAVVHGLWLLALVKLLTPPIAPLPLLPAWSGLPLLSERPTPTTVVIPVPRGADAWARAIPAAELAFVPPRPSASVPREAATTDVRPATTFRPAAPGPRLDWRSAAWALLAAGALAIAALAAWRFARFGRLLACARPAPPAVAERSAALAARLGLRHAPPVLVVPARVPPMLWPARGGPRLLLPETLATELRADELDALLAHELAHVRRRDHWVRLVEIAATALFWWYPVTWWARRALRRAEERCCDEWVLRVLPRSAEAYANGLLKSLTFVAGSPVPAVASGLGPVDDLEARLKEILMTRPAPRLGFPLRLALALAAALGLAVYPTHAQSSAPPTPPAPPAPAAKPARPSRPAPAAEPAPAPAPPRTPAPAPPEAIGAAPAVAPRAPVPPPDPPDLAPAPPLEPALSATTGRRDPERRALEEERKAIEERRRQLHQQELELAQKQVELEAQVQEAELRAMAERLRADGKAEEALRIEKQVQLNARRVDLQKRQLQLEAERAALEAKLEAEVSTDQGRLEAIEESRHERATEDARRELRRAEEARHVAEQELERKQHAIQAEMAAAEKHMQSLAARDQVKAVQEATEQLAQSLARQIESLKRAAADAPGERLDVDREIQRLQAALDALESGGTPKAAPGKTPRPQP